MQQLNIFFQNAEIGSIIWIIGVILFIASIFLDISKIKIDPWKWFFRKISVTLNANVLNAIDDLSKKMDEHEKKDLEYRKNQLRKSILLFADECRIGENHSKEMFRNVLKEINEYEDICKITKDPNHVIKQAINYIDKIYDLTIEQNGFL